MTEREPMSNEERRSALEIMRKCVEHSPTCPCKICELNSEACECESCKKAYAAFASTEPEQPASEGTEMIRWVEEALVDSYFKRGWYVSLHGAFPTRGIHVDDPGTYTFVLYRGNLVS